MRDAGFEALCADHYTKVVRVAYLVTGDRQEAMDVAQETFARAYERWGQVAKMQNQPGWLYRVATNLALSNHRRLRRARGLPEPGPQPEPIVEEPGLRDALATLTPSQRAAIVLRYYLDLSVAETAQVFGKQPGTVRALTSQGITRLREQLGETWMELSDE